MTSTTLTPACLMQAKAPKTRSTINYHLKRLAKGLSRH